MVSALKELTGETQSKILDLLRRAPRTITELASALELTDNAVRTHVGALTRDGLVEEVGSDRSTGGKPARRYGLTLEGEELYPKAYALALEAVLGELARQEGWPGTEDLLRAVGARLGAAGPATGDLPSRVRAAATALRELGADLEVQPQGTGWALQGHACPLSAVTSKHPQACTLVTAMVGQIVGRPVAERCAHGPRPRCRFEVAGG